MTEHNDHDLKSKLDFLRERNVHTYISVDIFNCKPWKPLKTIPLWLMQTIVNHQTFHKNVTLQVSGLKLLCRGFSNSNCGDIFRQKLTFEMTVQQKTLFISILFYRFH